MAIVFASNKTFNWTASPVMQQLESDPYLDSYSFQGFVLLVLSALSVLLAIPVLIESVKQKCIPIAVLGSWAVYSGLENVIAAIFWRNDNLPTWWWGEGFCDLVVKLDLAESVALLSTTALILRSLNLAVTASRAWSTPEDNRKQLILDVVACFGPAILVSGLHYLVQPSRYYIWALSGCVISYDSSWLLIVLMNVIPMLLALAALVYAVWLGVNVFHYHMDNFEILSNSTTGLSKTRFRRLYCLSLIVAFLYIPVTVYSLYSNSVFKPTTYSFAEDHSPSLWNDIYLVPSFGTVLWDRWVRASLGYALFFTLGAGGTPIKSIKTASNYCLKPIYTFAIYILALPFLAVAVIPAVAIMPFTMNRRSTRANARGPPVSTASAPPVNTTSLTGDAHLSNDVEAQRRERALESHSIIPGLDRFRRARANPYSTLNKTARSIKHAKNTVVSKFRELADPNSPAERRRIREATVKSLNNKSVTGADSVNNDNDQASTTRRHGHTQSLPANFMLGVDFSLNLNLDQSATALSFHTTRDDNSVIRGRASVTATAVEEGETIELDELTPSSHRNGNVSPATADTATVTATDAATDAADTTADNTKFLSSSLESDEVQVLSVDDVHPVPQARQNAGMVFANENGGALSLVARQRQASERTSAASAATANAILRKPTPQDVEAAAAAADAAEGQ